MITYQWLSAIIAFLIAFKIIFLIRRDVLHVRFAFWWFLVATLVVIAGVFPKFVDAIIVKFGVHYPPIVVVASGVGLMLVKMLTIDLEQSRQEQKIRRLAQRLAIFEAERDEDSSSVTPQTSEPPFSGNQKE